MAEVTLHMRFGFRVTLQELFEAFGGFEETTRVSEPRYDPRTGERVADVSAEKRVCTVTIDGVVVDLWDMPARLAERLGCDVICNDPISQYWPPSKSMREAMALLLSPEYPERESAPFASPFELIEDIYCGGDSSCEVRARVASYSLAELTEMSPALDDLAQRMERLGIDAKRLEQRVHVILEK